MDKENLITKKLIISKLITDLRHDPFFQNINIGLAISGGVDSIVLLNIFQKIKDKNNLNLYIMHYNHKWRKDSSKDAKLIKNYCKKFDLNFIYKEASGKIVKNEEHARNQRYAFFNECIKRYKLKVICTAHHKDDQIETIIFRLARGTGPKGLLPIKKVTKLNGTCIVRPLLDVTKDKIIRYAHNNKLSFNEDFTNKSLEYKRNLIRLKIIPELKKINPEASNNIIECAHLIYANSLLADKYFLSLLKAMSFKSAFKLCRLQFLRLDDYIQNAFLYWFLDRNNIQGSIAKIKIIKKIIQKESSMDLNNDFRLIINKRHILFYKKRILTNLKQINITFCLDNEKKEIKTLGRKKLVIKPFTAKTFYGNFPKDSLNIAYVNLSDFKNKYLTIRQRKPKDTFKPLGFPHVVKLKKYLVNKKISEKVRNNMPILYFKNEVLWLPGYSLSEKLRVKKKPTHILKVVSK